MQKYAIRTACAISLYGSVYDIAEPVGYAGSAIFGLRNLLLVEQLYALGCHSLLQSGYVEVSRGAA